jgi:hypothetical protein
LDQAALLRLLQLSEKGTAKTSSAIGTCVVSATQGTVRSMLSLAGRRLATATHKTNFKTQNSEVVVSSDTFRFDPSTGAVTLQQGTLYESALTAEEGLILGFEGMLGAAPADWHGLTAARAGLDADCDGARVLKKARSE